uniref:Carcinoma-related EF-hand protein n=2 Tax=Molossus molossus TaxID=27622 RepID=A0A7J8F6L2_MOLMO|nr:carcinoma-related EF-hand protein [Molossus molossus]
MKSPEEELQPENLPAETSAPKDPPSSLMIRPVSQPFVSPAMKHKSEECETWIDRFRKLENALYLCDLSNTGVLEKERARRLIHNYNLIYNLSLSPRKIDQALKRFRSGGNTLLEPALQYLKEL